MRCLLMKCHRRRRPGLLNPIVTEPLELEVLATELEQAGIPWQIFDPWLEKASWSKALLDYHPDVLALSCYVTGVPELLATAQQAKKLLPELVVVVGGVHAQLNPADFQHPAIDHVFTSANGRAFVEYLLGEGLVEERTNETAEPSGLKNGPDRRYLLQHLAQTRYLEYSPVALVQGALSCPHSCNYCYCRLLNQGQYVPRPVQAVLAEINACPSEYVWLIDDCFLLDRARVEEFIAGLAAGKAAKKIIAYSRTDFIIQHPDLLPQLKQAGFVELIVGMESIDPEQLTQWEKSGGADINAKVADSLALAGIRLTALFMVHPDFSRQDFQRLDNWLAQQSLDCYTVAIFTPLAGTKIYDQYKDRIANHDLAKRDFLHLTMPPTQMSRLEFYWRFILLHRHQPLRTRRGRRDIGKGQTSSSRIWDFWAKGYEKLWVQRYSLGPTRRQIIAYLEELLEHSRPLRILDVGCGTGQTLREIQECFSARPLDLTGIDYSQEMVRQANLRSQGITYRQLDVARLSELGQTYDIILCTHSFPYYRNQPQALEKMARQLASGGHLLLAHASGVTEYDRWAMFGVKLTTGKAHYPSPKEVMAMSEAFLDIIQVVPIKEKWFMPSIYTFLFQKPLSPKAANSGGEVTR